MAQGFGQRCLALVHLAKQHPPRWGGVGADTQFLEHICAEAGCLESERDGPYVTCHPELSLCSPQTASPSLWLATRLCLMRALLTNVGILGRAAHHRAWG